MASPLPAQIPPPGNWLVDSPFHFLATGTFRNSGQYGPQFGPRTTGRRVYDAADLARLRLLHAAAPSSNLTDN
eukprot:6420405-Heterocapsa_arctica.AAC.1